jgi:hypothetical protein
LDSAIAGGAGGSDSFAVEDPDPAHAGAFTVIEPDSTGEGTLNVNVIFTGDARTVVYRGMEASLYVDSSNSENVTVSTCFLGEEMILEPGPSVTELQLRSVDNPTFPLLFWDVELFGFSVSTRVFEIPTESLTIDLGGGNDGLTVATDLSLSGADLTIRAETITVNPGVTISTREILPDGNHLSSESIADSGDITFEGEKIMVGSGAALLAQAENSVQSFQSGDITLEAESTVGLRPNVPFFDMKNSDAKIELTGAILKGRNVKATATSDTSKFTTEGDDPSVWEVCLSIC